MIYLDNAATSWPKPEAVYEAVDKALREYGGNPGRGSHRMSLAAAELIREARMLCARLFHAERPDCICFAPNTTEALNLAIKGILRPGWTAHSKSPSGRGCIVPGTPMRPWAPSAGAEF